jgi:hypothetical protein
MYVELYHGGYAIYIAYAIYIGYGLGRKITAIARHPVKARFQQCALRLKGCRLAVVSAIKGRGTVHHIIQTAAHTLLQS